MVTALALSAALLTACETTGGQAESGDPRDKVVAAYGQPDARQSNGDVEVWQYCEAAEDGSEGSKDRLRLLWLIDGVVAGESHHEYDLNGCNNLYVVDLRSLPHRG